MRVLKQQTTEEMYHCVINNLGVRVEEVLRRYGDHIKHVNNKHNLEAYRQHLYLIVCVSVKIKVLKQRKRWIIRAPSGTCCNSC